MARNHVVFHDPQIARFLFGNTKTSWFWLLIRLYVGWAWFEAGWQKVTNAAWTGSGAGTSLAGFVSAALSKTTGAHPDVQTWYAWFLEHAVLPHAAAWSHAVAYGETLIGIALILGLLTGIAAFFGALMNLNFLLAGAVSVNPILGILALALIMAWKVAGWWGLDRWALPALGTPWQHGTLT